ncbi:MAG: hypothetical protein U5K75_03650 [Ahrensia sp.]|nr:hypothetical protein [Ahrensia sp.]
MKLRHTATLRAISTTHQMIAASAVMIIIALVAMGAWFAQSNTLLGSIIQAGLAWCF